VPCFYPQTAYTRRRPNADGKKPISFKWVSGVHNEIPITLPCGGCIGCRLERSKQWAIRCVNEASQHENNSFITLTYNEANLPRQDGPEGHPGTLAKEHYQLFMKRLRRKYSQEIRFFHCGEYGDEKGRPHYHACLFNHDFEDKKLWKIVRGNPLYVSEQLDERWGLGFCSVGALTYQSAAYVARYILKKVTGKLAPSHYEWADPETGEIFQRLPEYATMSKGIGQSWIKKYKSDVYPGDFVVLDGKKHKPPRYYDQQQEEDALEAIKESRSIRAMKQYSENQPARRKVRETVLQARLTGLKRKMETQ